MLRECGGSAFLLFLHNWSDTGSREGGIVFAQYDDAPVPCDVAFD